MKYKEFIFLCYNNIATKLLKVCEITKRENRLGKIKIKPSRRVSDSALKIRCG